MANSSTLPPPGVFTLITPADPTRIPSPEAVRVMEPVQDQAPMAANSRSAAARISQFTGEETVRKWSSWSGEESFRKAASRKIDGGFEMAMTSGFVVGIHSDGRK